MGIRLACPESFGAEPVSSCLQQHTETDLSAVQRVELYQSQSSLHQEFTGVTRKLSLAVFAIIFISKSFAMHKILYKTVNQQHSNAFDGELHSGLQQMLRLGLLRMHVRAQGGMLRARVEDDDQPLPALPKRRRATAPVHAGARPVMAQGGMLRARVEDDDQPLPALPRQRSLCMPVPGLQWHRGWMYP